jgi:hypothetical protein
VSRRLAQTHLASIHRVVEPLPTRLAEAVEQELRDVLEAGRPVEVHEEGSDRDHGGSA